MYNPGLMLNFALNFTERPCCGAVASAADDDVGPLLLGPCGGGARNAAVVAGPVVGQKNGRQNGRRKSDEGKALAVAVAVR